MSISLSQENETDDATNKSCSKVDDTVKLQIIHALDNGRNKTEIAREYNILPKTVSYIYKQKTTIIKRYTQKYNLQKEICSLNLDQNLLEWFEHLYTSGHTISEEQLCNKAIEILERFGEAFTCIDAWLLDFIKRHNINKYTCDTIEQHKVEWKRFLRSSNTNDVYIGGVCALAYNKDFNDYLNGIIQDNYVSLFYIINTLGTDQLKLAIIGNEYFDTETNVKSLPVDYYHCDITQINYTNILTQLTKWDNLLASQGKTVTLLLNLPDDFIENLHLNHIKLISVNNMNYVISIMEKLVESFKYHYRRLQITRCVTYGKENCTFLDYVYMMSMAWYSVSNKFVQYLCFTPEDGSLYFTRNDNMDYNHSLLRWLNTYNLPLIFEGDTADVLDKYILCDDQLPCINYGLINEGMSDMSEVLAQRVYQHQGGMEAYQAMKRLMSYLQEESAGGSIMKCAKYLENHIEYGALLHMRQIMANTNN